MSLARAGYANGSIPANTLAAVADFRPLADGWASTAHGSHLTDVAGARQLSGMQQAFYRRFGVRLYVREAYRSFEGQSWYYNRFINREPGWTLAAYPRTSVHGWALSVDLGVGEVNADPSGEYLAWLRVNAETYGFRNDVPSETWHWSFLLAPVTTIPNFISNPAGSATAGPATPSEDDDMPASVNYVYCIMDKSQYQNALYAIDATTGNARHVLEFEERAIARGRGLSVAEWRAKYAEGINGPQVAAMLKAAGGEQKVGYVGKVKTA